MGPTLDPNRIHNDAEGCEGSPDRAAANSTDSAVEIQLSRQRETRCTPLAGPTPIVARFHRHEWAPAN